MVVYLSQETLTSYRCVLHTVFTGATFFHVIWEVGEIGIFTWTKKYRPEMELGNGDLLPHSAYIFGNKKSLEMSRRQTKWLSR